jgi:uncharacterized membrane-anchored protein
MAGSAVAGKDKVPTRAKSAEPAPAAEAAAPAGSGSRVEAEEPAEADPLASIPHLVGPRQVELGHHARIDLPTGMVLLEEATAKDLMHKLGNSTEGVVAVITPHARDAKWLVVIEADDVGYVNDGDADELDASSMLAQFKQGTVAQNKKRVEMGIPELVLDGWTEPPRYERASHHLVWGLNAHDKDGKVVNFFTRFLGRDGYLSVNLIDDPATIEQSKAQALAVLTAVHFAPGFRYEDHAEGDHDSGLGLKALVLGGTAVVLAKKGGILIAILLALKKGIVVVVLAVVAFFKRLFRGKREGSVAAIAPAASSGVAPPPDDDPPAG